MKFAFAFPAERFDKGEKSNVSGSLDLFETKTERVSFCLAPVRGRMRGAAASFKHIRLAHIRPKDNRYVT